MTFLALYAIELRLKRMEWTYCTKKLCEHSAVVSKTITFVFILRLWISDSFCLLLLNFASKHRNFAQFSSIKLFVNKLSHTLYCLSKHLNYLLFIFIFHAFHVCNEVIAILAAGISSFLSISYVQYETFHFSVGFEF